MWTPAAQADLLRNALERLGVSQTIVSGHSWGASVAVALALKYPGLVKGLVLASGYYYRSFRPGVLSAPATPLVGDILGHTLSPLVSRLMWPPPKLKMPVSIVAGDEDRLADIDAQSARLHAHVLQST